MRCNPVFIFFVIPYHFCAKMDNESCSDSEIEVEVTNNKANKSQDIKTIQDACNNNSSSGSNNAAPPPASPPTLFMGQQGPHGPTVLGPRPRYPSTFSPVGPVPTVSPNHHPLLRQASFKQDHHRPIFFNFF